MAADAVLAIKIVTDYAQGAAGLDAAGGRAAKFGAGLKRLALPAGVALAAVVAFGKGAVDAASRTEQAMGGVDAVFGKNAGTVRQWASEAANSVGLSKSAYGELATVIGSQLKNAGFSMEDVTTKTGDLIAKGADLAAMFGGTTADAVAALSSTLKGENDPIERYGASINEAAVSAELAAHGWDKLTGAALAQAKAQARMNLITEQTADAEGAAARERDTAAASSQRLAAQYENLQASLGTALLPMFVSFATLLSKVTGFMAKHTTATKVIIGVIAALAVGILALNVALGVYTAVTTLAASTTLIAWAPVILPILAVVAGIALVAAGMVLLWKKSATFRNIVMGAWKAIRGAFSAMVGFIKKNWKTMLIAMTGPIGIAVALIIKNWAKIRSTVSTVTGAIKTLWRNAIDAVRTKLSGFKSTAVAMWNSIKTAVGNVVSRVGDLVGKVKDIKVPGAIVTALDNIKTAADKVLGVIKDIIEWLKNIPTPHIDWPSPPKWIDKIPGLGRAAVATDYAAPSAFGVPAVAGYGAPRVGSTVAASSVMSGGLTIINVTGALDPEAVARQIERVTSGHRRRVGLRS